MCASCGARVGWALTDRAKWIPVDPEPALAGNVVVSPEGRATVLTLATIADDEPDPARRFVSHFATCPDAEQWRRA